MQTLSNETTIDVQLPCYFGGHFNYNPLLHDEHFIYIHTHTWPLEFYLRTVNNFTVNFLNNSVAIVDELQEE